MPLELETTPEYRQLVAQRDDVHRRIRAYNERAYNWNDRDVGCPDNCEHRGQPHTHVRRQRPYIRLTP